MSTEASFSTYTHTHPHTQTHTHTHAHSQALVKGCILAVWNISYNLQNTGNVVRKFKAGIEVGGSGGGWVGGWENDIQPHKTIT